MPVSSGSRPCRDGRIVDAYDLAGEVVRAAVGERDGDDPLCRIIQIVGMRPDDIRHLPVADEIVHAVRTEDQAVAPPRRRPSCSRSPGWARCRPPATDTRLARDADAMIRRELLDVFATHPADAAIARIWNTSAVADLSTTADSVLTMPRSLRYCACSAC